MSKKFLIILCLNIFLATCYQESCKSNEYYDSSSSSCKPCDDSCETCSGPLANHCLSCIDGMTLDGGWCSCQHNEYFDVEPKKCKNCHSSCSLTCTGPSRSSCSSCTFGEFSFNNKCFSKCLSSEYFDLKSFSCQPCSLNCSSCTGSRANECTSCLQNYVLYKGMCVQECPTSFYAGSERICLPCDDSCSTCSGPSGTDCLSCRPNHILSEGKCLIINSSLTCHDSCRYCGDSSEKGCKSCQEGLFFIPDQNELGYCRSECPEGFTGLTLTNKSICKMGATLEAYAENTQDPSTFIVGFDKNIEKYYSTLVSNINVSIRFYDNQPSLTYEYSFLFKNSTNEIIIELTFGDYLGLSNLLIITLPETIFNNETVLSVKETYFSFYLQEQYTYNNLIQTIGTVSSKVVRVTSQMNAIYSLFSSCVFQSLHAIRSELIESMLNMFIFMNIYFPSNFLEFSRRNLEAFDTIAPNFFAYFNTQQAQSFNQNSNQIPYKDNNMPEQPVFDLYLSSKLFFQNFGSNLSLLTSIMLFAICCEICVFIFNKMEVNSRVKQAFSSLSISLRWNLIINEFISSYQESTFFALLALKYSENFIDSIGSGLILIAALFMIIIGAIINRKAHVYYNASEQNDNTVNEQVKNFLKRCKILYGSLSSRSFLNFLFFEFLMIRSFGFAILLVFATSLPYLQLIYLFLTTVSFICYLIKLKPFKERCQLIITLLYEIMLLLSIIGASLLHIYNQSHIEDVETRGKIGLIMIFASLGMTLTNFASFALELYEFVKFFKKKIRITPINNKKPVSQPQNSIAPMPDVCKKSPPILASDPQSKMSENKSNAKPNYCCDIDNNKSLNEKSPRNEGSCIDFESMAELNIKTKRFFVTQSKPNLFLRSSDRFYSSSCLDHEKNSTTDSLTNVRTDFKISVNLRRNTLKRRTFNQASSFFT